MNADAKKPELSDLDQAALYFHQFPTPGKLEIQATKPLGNQRDQALAYSPGVAAPCLAIHADPDNAADYTSREENCCSGATVVRGLTGDIVNRLSPDEGVALVADPFNRVAYSNRSTEQDIKDKGVSGEVNWLTPWFGGATLTSITARSRPKS